jgi:putative flippase GtrA
MKFLRELSWFAAIGTVGLLVDTAVLYALKSMLGLFAARVVSFLAAASTTWLMNRTFTFRTRRSNLSGQREFVTYIGIMLVGGVANFATYTCLVIWYEIVKNNPVIGVAAGSLAGMFFNYFSAKFLIFRSVDCDTESTR